ncbi:MAG: AzlD domain-containing protein [Chloroflexota bacterium]
MTSSEFFLILGMTIVTFGVRYPVLALVSKIRLPEQILSALKFVPPAVLSAIIFPAVFMPKGTVDLTLQNAELGASVLAALIAWRSKNLLLTIVVGMAIYLGWRWLTL